MTKFPNIPALHRCPNRWRQRVYALCGDLYYPDGAIVPRGFKSDGVSRPWFLRKWLKRFGKGFAAFIRHDYDYAVQIEPRHVADSRLHSLLTLDTLPEEERFSEFEANLIHGALTMFGGLVWRRNARRSNEYFFCPEEELNNPKRYD